MPSDCDPPLHPFILQPQFLQFLEILFVEIWFEKSGSRNLVREIWFKKNGSRKMVDQKKKSEFAEPLFYTFLEKWSQNKWSIALRCDYSNKVLWRFHITKR